MNIRYLKSFYVLINFVSIIISISLLIFFSLTLYSLKERENELSNSEAFQRTDDKFKNIFIIIAWIEILFIFCGFYGIILLLGRSHHFRVHAFILIPGVVLYILMSVCLVVHIDENVVIPVKYRNTYVCLKVFENSYPQTSDMAIKGINDCIYFSLWTICCHVFVMFVVICCSLFLWNLDTTVVSPRFIVPVPYPR